MNQRRQTILVVFCFSESVASIIPNVGNLFTRGIWSAAQIHEELKRTEFSGAFCKKFKLLMDRLSSFLRRKTEKKIIHQKKNRDHQTCKIVKSRQSYSNDYLPDHSFYYLTRAPCTMWHVNLRALEGKSQMVPNSRKMQGKWITKKSFSLVTT